VCHTLHTHRGKHDALNFKSVKKTWLILVFSFIFRRFFRLSGTERGLLINWKRIRGWGRTFGDLGRCPAVIQLRLFEVIEDVPRRVQ
jgi:hypothetical protein